MTYSVAVKLNYPSGYSAQNDSVSITLKNTVNNSSFTAVTNAKGIAVFTVPTGVYQASATESRPISGVSYNFNGLKDFTVADNWALTDSVKIDLAMSKASQIIIKELYNGGCNNTIGGASVTFLKDQYVILYNNSDKPASLDNLCLGMALPFNSNGSTNADYVGGTLSYTDWVPAGMGIWYFSNGIILKPGQQIVVALANAVDNTSTYPNSINFANSGYYCTYDMREKETGKLKYPDANFSMRLTYGTVCGANPRDGLIYKSQTTLKGVIEKEDSSNYEFQVSPRLKQLYATQDYGRYAEKGTLYTCFLTSTDITGGNSGSPVINGKGELIGIAFDGNWESLAGNFIYEPQKNRSVNVDIRYVLFVIDKFAKASNIIKELIIR